MRRAEISIVTVAVGAHLRRIPTGRVFLRTAAAIHGDGGVRVCHRVGVDHQEDAAGPAHGLGQRGRGSTEGRREAFDVLGEKFLVLGGAREHHEALKGRIGAHFESKV